MFDSLYSQSTKILLKLSEKWQHFAAMKLILVNKKSVFCTTSVSGSVGVLASRIRILPSTKKKKLMKTLIFSVFWLLSYLLVVTISLSFKTDVLLYIHNEIRKNLSWTPLKKRAGSWSGSSIQFRGSVSVSKLHGPRTHRTKQCDSIHRSCLVANLKFLFNKIDVVLWFNWDSRSEFGIQMKIHEGISGKKYQIFSWQLEASLGAWSPSWR